MEKDVQMDKSDQIIQKQNQINPYIWKTTLNENSYIPIKLYTKNIKEITENKDNELENLDNYFQIKKFQNNQNKIYYKNQLAYHKKLDKYVQVQKNDQEKEEYTCLYLNQSNQENQRDQIHKNDLISIINIQASVFETAQITENNKTLKDLPNIFANVKVNILDNISKICDFFQFNFKDSINYGSILYRNQIIQLPSKITFQQLDFKNNDKIVYLANSNLNKDPIIWSRFNGISKKKLRLKSGKWEAIQFIPNKDINFFGFGVMANRNGQDMKIIIQWVIGQESSEEHMVELLDFKKNDLYQWHVIDIRNLDQRPVSVKNGTAIHCKIKLFENETNQDTYSGVKLKGGDQLQSYYQNQSIDFIVKKSFFCDRQCTIVKKGQIPFIFYN